MAPTLKPQNMYCFRNCNPDSMDGEMIKGKIVLCDNDDNSYSIHDKEDEVQSLGGIGLVLVDENTWGCCCSPFPRKLNQDPRHHLDTTQLYQLQIHGNLLLVIKLIYQD